MIPTVAEFISRFAIFRKGTLSRSGKLWAEDKGAFGKKRFFLRCPSCSKINDITNIGFGWMQVGSERTFGDPSACIVCTCSAHFNAILDDWERPPRRVLRMMNLIQEACDPVPMVIRHWPLMVDNLFLVQTTANYPTFNVYLRRDKKDRLRVDLESFRTEKEMLVYIRSSIEYWMNREKQKPMGVPS